VDIPQEALEELQAPKYESYHSDGEALHSEILPMLWLGGTADEDVITYNLKRPRITLADYDTVVTMYAAANPVDWHVREIRYGVWDSAMTDFDYEDLFDLVRLAHVDWKRGKRVLIRCQAGWNRSSLIMALVLIRDGWPAADAIRLMRAQRSPYVLCNRDFERWLLSVDAADWQGEYYGS
jgi:protein-tyrosine phosphatase